MQGVLWTEPSATVVDSHSWFGVFDQFMTGYKRETDLDARWEAMVPSFLSYRRLLLYTVFSQEWKRPNAWHAARLRAWRRGIVEGVPVVGWRER
jgi:Ser/Thr protein kinase RdoA (MazF antagonist)